MRRYRRKTSTIVAGLIAAILASGLPGASGTETRGVIDADRIAARLGEARGLTRDFKVRPREHDSIDIPIYFDFDSDRIKPVSRPQLREIARALATPGLAVSRIRIEGHTDGAGSPAYNRALSERRASSVRQALVERHGIDGSRLDAVGLGQSAPVASNRTETGRARNRRVTLVALGGR